MSAFNQRNHVAHAQNPAGHAVGVEDVERVHFLAGAHELDRFIHHRPDGKCRPAPRITVEFGEHHAVEVKAVVEGFGRVHRILPGHGIHDKQGFGRIQSQFYLLNFLHHHLVNRQSAGSVHDHYFLAGPFGVGQCILHNRDGIFIFRLCKHLNANLFAQHF